MVIPTASGPMTITTTERPVVPARVEAAEPAPETLRLYWCLLAGVLLAGVGSELGALAGLPGHPTWYALHHALRYPFFVLALATPLILQAGARPPWRELAATVGLGVVCGLALCWLAPSAGLDVGPANALGAGLGAASLAVMVVRAVAGRGAGRARALGALLPALLLVGLTGVAITFLRLSYYLCPVTDDALLYAADAALGRQWSFAVGRLFHDQPGLELAGVFTYVAAMGAFALLLVLHHRADPSQRRTPLPVFMGASLIGYCIYLLFPAVGPGGYFGKHVFPESPPEVATVLATTFVPAGLPRTACPRCTPPGRSCCAGTAARWPAGSEYSPASFWP